MLKPVTPPDEALRVDSLRALEILDTPAEERFDRLTRVAKRLFDVPIVLISLVDSDRQWFKSCIGLDVTQTPREISFCAHAILDDGILLVPDAASDERFDDNPLVTGEPHIRFYAGCPLKAPDGSRVGTLCIIDRAPRTFEADDLAMLRDIAHMAERELAAVQVATMDSLTMLSNRRGFEALARHALGVCRRLGHPAVLLYFDLDRFKSINDRLGHAEGDRALFDFARLLASNFRESDVIGRIGGDEFTVLATGSGTAALQSSLVRLRESVVSHCSEHQHGYDLGYSLGTARFDPERHAGVVELMAEADTLMYEDKRARHASGETDQQRTPPPDQREP